MVRILLIIIYALASATIGSLAGMMQGLPTGIFSGLITFLLMCQVDSAVLRRPLGPRGSAVALAGCIPMVPGAFLGQAILGMLAVTTPHPENAAVILTAIEYLLRVFFTLAAIGAGLAIPAHLLKHRDF